MPLLFGCQNVDITVNDGNKFHLMMTLEHASYFKYDYTHFKGIGKKTTAEEIIDRVNYGEDVLFAYSKEDCSSCENFLKNAGRNLYYSHYRISYIDEDTAAAASTINKYAIAHGIERVFAHPMSGGTPSLYVMSKERIVELAYGSNDDDEKIVTTAFKEYLAETNVSHCGLSRWHIVSGYKGYARENTQISYVLTKEKEEDFYKNVYPIVLNSRKPFCVLDLEGSDKNSTQMKKLYQMTGREDIEGKILKVEIKYNEDDPEEEETKTATVIDDVQSFLEENYVSSSL
ncbi:MAG: hypothetical protein K6G74_04125 [Bacilli bacterium]|nr:hypothetical protein [Bacilli bacterium]